MKSLKKVIATAMMGLVLTFGSAALVYAHTCPPDPGGKKHCWYEHFVSPATGTHYCILWCD